MLTMSWWILTGPDTRFNHFTVCITALQSQKAVTACLKSKQLSNIGFARQISLFMTLWRGGGANASDHHVVLMEVV